MWTNWEDDAFFPDVELEVTVLIVDKQPDSAGRVAVLCSSDGVHPVDDGSPDSDRVWVWDSDDYETGALQANWTNVSPIIK